MLLAVTYDAQDGEPPGVRAGEITTDDQVSRAAVTQLRQNQGAALCHLGHGFFCLSVLFCSGMQTVLFTARVAQVCACS